MAIVRRSLERDFEEVKVHLAESAAENASGFISSYTSLMMTIGELDEIAKLKKEEYVGLIRRILESHPAIGQISVYDKGGRWLYGMERMPGTIEAVNNVAQISEYTLGEIQKMGNVRGSIIRVANHPAMEIFVAIRRKSDRQIVGYMRNILSLLPISESLADSKIGKSSELFLLDYKDRVIAASNYKKYFSGNGAAAVDPQILSQMHKLGPYQNWRGKSKLADGRDVIIAMHKLDELPWVSVVIEESWEAFVVMIELKQKIFEVVLIVSLFVLGFALFFANRISSPVRHLIRAVREIAAGDFTQEVGGSLPKPNNEIGELANAFETMSTVLANRTKQLMSAQDDLKRFNLELEARVDARTKELRATQDELIKQERVAAIGQMASVIGHELRNPLSVINNSIYVIRNRLGMADTEHPNIDPKIAKHVQTIEGELHVANQIISEILTFARTREIQPRDVVLHDFLEEVLGRLSLPEKVELVKSYAPSPITLKMDPDEMRQAMRNLIGNAVDAMPNGGKLAISTVVHGNHALVLVEDSGLGIAADSLAKVFTPFYTTKSKGTGLGLAVVRKVMDRHNGEAMVESTVGKGTKFTLKLPIS